MELGLKIIFTSFICALPLHFFVWASAKRNKLEKLTKEEKEGIDNLITLCVRIDIICALGIIVGLIVLIWQW